MTFKKDEGSCSVPDEKAVSDKNKTKQRNNKAGQLTLQNKWYPTQ